jgi:hypothetical protein
VFRRCGQRWLVFSNARLSACRARKAAGETAALRTGYGSVQG